ncbi:hypothetical protein [Shimia sp. MMG029]|uniref:hypothetical protein n=1 Tax=Shimia sp. MMG029 TaxID=3021978 RepID=UPI0022FF05F6|nr:hypothetical protein [Shimia sp. MMG029]MDA5556700.1 hypothetical protein [Shimia sp. MMG029]
MITDYMITIGLVVGVFAIPAMISAYADNRLPKVSFAMFALCAAGIATTILLHPERYSLLGLPDVVVRVIADILH